MPAGGVTLNAVQENGNLGHPAGISAGIAPGTTSAMSVPIQWYPHPHPPNVASAAPERPLICFKPGELRHKGIKRTAQQPHGGLCAKDGNLTLILDQCLVSSLCCLLGSYSGG